MQARNRPKTSTVDPTTVTGAATAQATPDMYETVDVRTAYEALATDEDAQLVDVRRPDEWAATGVPFGAVLIPIAELERRALAELDPSRPVYVICKRGKRSRQASETLVGLGFARVYNVGEGIQAWLRAGLPVDSYEA